MKVTVIGCFGAYPPQNGATSGYLVEHQDTKVLLDCGSGVLAKLQNYISLNELDGVVFSHYHRDHCADLECLQFAAMIDTKLGKRSSILIMRGNEDTENAPELGYKEYCKGLKYAAGEEFCIGQLRFIAQANQHDIPSFSIKVEDSHGGCIVYSGDTGYYEHFCSFARGADWLICECSLYTEQKGMVAGHLCADEVGMIAAKAKVKNLLLTHLPHYGNLSLLVNEAGVKFTGPIVLAKSGMVLDTNNRFTD